MISRPFRALLALVLVHAGLHAGIPESPRKAISRYEIQQDLMGSVSVVVEQRTGTTLPGAMQGNEADRKSVGLAAIYSLLLPGMGELYAGGFESGRYFLIAEGALWFTYLAFDVYGNTLRDDARLYAVSHAGITPAGKDEQFYVNIGNFINTAEYNDKKLRDREPDRLYLPNSGFDWQWASDDARAFYRDQRISSENVFNNRKFVVAAVIVNHVLSAINAGRSAIRHNAQLDQPLGGLRVRADVIGGPFHAHGIELTFSKPL
ncbi:MAG: hypothetical protein OEM41_01845 [Ignavibacteria bacterium]|nr:hypothetical protein [Ignavibacteria bacterium]